MKKKNKLAKLNSVQHGRWSPFGWSPFACGYTPQKENSLPLKLPKGGTGQSMSIQDQFLLAQIKKMNKK